jgi:hypothetical protein
MAPKSKKAAGAGRRAGAKYKDDRVPGPAVATEEYAAVSFIPAVRPLELSCSLFSQTPAHNNPVTHALPLWLGCCFAKTSLRLQ